MIPGFPQQQPAEAPQPVCSAKGCRESALWQVVWNNPKLHTPDRRKVWLACDEHRQTLSDFLDLRGFLIGVEPFTGEDAEDASDSSPTDTAGS